ncbi:muscarinic acetylcholine receptor M4-like [Schistocerca serialis cubense]|uniref:muscarinic acetylcholine receptor M4-like n=1 Tax=Schistocerca serialis cubense TaxID=2023355 RepID=UPI00214E7E93|nr:muscarinic acetylcholine receptor M4-like [Schistocerca serialis cubense]
MEIVSADRGGRAEAVAAPPPPGGRTLSTPPPAPPPPPPPPPAPALETENGQEIDASTGTEGTEVGSAAAAGEEAPETQDLTTGNNETPAPAGGCDETLTASNSVNKVKRIRESAKEGLLLLAKKIKAASCNKIPKPSVGQNMGIKVPDADRAKMMQNLQRQ